MFIAIFTARAVFDFLLFMQLELGLDHIFRVGTHYDRDDDGQNDLDDEYDILSAHGGIFFGLRQAFHGIVVRRAARVSSLMNGEEAASNKYLT